MRLLLLLLALVAACATPEPADLPSPTPGDTVTVEGTITSVDLEPMAYDGNATIWVETDHGDVSVHVPARTNLCKATGLELVWALQPGDVIEVRGEWAGDGSITPCASSEHGIVLQSTSGGAVYRGVYETGFETSAFHPCDQPAEQWWVHAEDEDFSTRYTEIRQQHAAIEGRGLRLFVEATVLGDLSPEGEYGHLGQYTKRLTVTGTRGMTFLAVNPDSTVSCR